MTKRFAYDAIADAHLHGQPALVWIVGDNLCGSVFMLILIPALSIVLSTTGAVAVQLRQVLRRPRRRESLSGVVS